MNFHVHPGRTEQFARWPPAKYEIFLKNHILLPYSQELLLYDLIYQLTIIREHVNNIEALIAGIWYSHG